MQIFTCAIYMQFSAYLVLKHYFCKGPVKNLVVVCSMSCLETRKIHKDFGLDLETIKHSAAAILDKGNAL